ncbi:MAG: DMT family transporter [Gammaproteobacteria bacterium]|nr:DMT family transporter [Gammaproteobacteria bacterium]
MPTTKPSVPPRALVLLLIVTFVWGTSWPLFPMAMREFSVWTFRTLSLSSGGMLMLVVARLRGESLRIPREFWPEMVLTSLCYLVVWNIASAMATLLIPSGQTAVLGFTMPLWSVLISWLFLREPISPRLWCAVMFGGASVSLLIIPGIATYTQAPLGFGLGLLGGLGWAIGTLIMKRRPVPTSPLVATGWQILIASIPISVVALILGDGQWFVPSTQTIIIIAYITVVPLCIGNLCWFSIVRALPANLAGLSMIMVPVLAMITGALVLHEPLGPLEVGAIFCSVAALALVVFRPASR